MKTPDVIKEGLEVCRADECHGHHTDCPYEDDFFCIMHICGDALAYIEHLEEQISLMKIQMLGDCGVCKHRNERPSEGSTCNKCAVKDGHPLWEYEGLPELPKK